MPTATEGVRSELAAHLCAQLARMLLADGADAECALRQVDRTAEALGQPVHVQLDDGAVLVTAGDVSGFGTRVLVPGVPLINGVRDLVGGHAGLGVSRLALAIATVLAIGFALFLAAGVVGDVLPVEQGSGRLPVLEDVAFSAAAVLGYAMLFDVPPRALPAAMLCGVLCHSNRTVLAGAGIDRVAGSLLGALLAGAAARLAARVYRVPAVTSAFPGTVATIPGSHGFRAGIGGLHLMTLGQASPAPLVANTVSLAITIATMTIAIGVRLSLAFATIPTIRPRTRDT